jgi:hypothetical protein
MPHEKDLIGYPIDPELRALQFKLGDLAMEWRGMNRGIEGQREILAEYHAVMEKLYQLDWDDLLDVDAELPDAFMPAEYRRRHPKLPR